MKFRKALVAGFGMACFTGQSALADGCDQLREDRNLKEVSYVWQEARGDIRVAAELGEDLRSLRCSIDTHTGMYYFRGDNLGTVTLSDASTGERLRTATINAVTVYGGSLRASASLSIAGIANLRQLVVYQAARGEGGLAGDVRVCATHYDCIQATGGEGGALGRASVRGR